MKDPQAAKPDIDLGALKNVAKNVLDKISNPGNTRLDIVDGVTTIYKNKVTRIDAAKNSLFREIVKVMLESVTGECISGSGSFSSTLFTNVNGEITAHLIPTRRELMQVFRELYITFDKKEHLPLEVVMTEEGGDTTTITLRKN